MLQTLIDAVKYENERTNDKGKTEIETMYTIIDRHPKFWKEKTIIDIIVYQISKRTLFINVIRESALELVFSLAKKNPSIIKKSSNFINIFLLI